jgi:hypothetical protein
MIAGHATLPGCGTDGLIGRQRPDGTTDQTFATKGFVIEDL